MSSPNSTFALDVAKGLPDLGLKCSSLDEAKNYCLRHCKIDGVDCFVGRYKTTMLGVFWSYTKAAYVVETFPLLGIRIIS